jgi:hypothetical protein
MAGSVEEATEVHTEAPYESVDTWAGVEVDREGREQGRRAWDKKNMKKRRSVSFAIVSNHLLSFSILYMDSHHIERREARG